MNRYKTSAFGIIIVALVFGFLLFRNDFLILKQQVLTRKLLRKFKQKKLLI